MRNLRIPSVLLITFYLLGLTIHGIFAHPGSHDDHHEELDQVNQALDEVNDRLDDIEDRVTNQEDKNQEQDVDIGNLEQDQEEEDVRDEEEAQDDLVDEGLDAVPLVGPVVKKAKKAVDAFYPSCNGPDCNDRSEPIRLYGPNYHRRTCRAGHQYWSCSPGKTWQHRDCVAPSSGSESSEENSWNYN